MTKITNPLSHYVNIMRLDRPIGIFVVLWPSLIALWLASDGFPGWYLIMLFTSGAIIVRSAGCIINDICDRRFDSSVNRTRHRPIASGAISLTKACIVLLLLLSIALYLVLQLNLYSFIVAIIALLCISCYPLFKRFTYYPQVFLGLTINFGILIAFTAVQNQLPPLAFLLLATVAIWTVIYDTMYAVIDIEDDIKIGVKSTAQAFGRHTILILIVLRILFYCGVVAVGKVSQLPNLYDILTLLIVLFLVWETLYTKKNNAATFFSAFTHSHLVALLWLFIIIIALWNN